VIDGAVCRIRTGFLIVLNLVLSPRSSGLFCFFGDKRG